LWFTNTPSLYKSEKNGYNGGGWIKSLQSLISSNSNIELAISFFHDDKCFKATESNIVYYPISLYNTNFKKIIHNLFYNKYDKIELAYFMKVINDFQPDVIHVFGTEKSFGLITRLTKIPVVIHLQGILNPYLNAYFPPGVSLFQTILNKLMNPLGAVNFLKSFLFFKHNAKREAEILSNCNFFMGRTDWDKNISKLYAPSSTYFYCSEVLREKFYETFSSHREKSDKFILVSTISKTTYKGFDLILKTANLLKNNTNLVFEWNVFGVQDYKEWELILGIKSIDVGINIMGIKDEDNLVISLTKGDVFIHTSYIDNSPNSICEAQMLGLPVISTDVGGISSLITNEISGYLVASNDPFTIAYKVLEIKGNQIKANKIGEKGRQIALRRHDRETIKNDLFNCYYNIINAK
jgi:glycosyltransferase involved in cell wall biosynthesis